MFEKLMFLLYFPVFDRQFTPPKKKAVGNYDPEVLNYELIAIGLVGLTIIILIVILISKLIKK